MTLLEETRVIQKRLGSTPFPDDLQGIADDANVIIARQAFLVAQLKGDLAKARAEGRREALREAVEAVAEADSAELTIHGIGVILMRLETLRDSAWNEAIEAAAGIYEETFGTLAKLIRARQPWPADMIEAFRAEADGMTLLLFEVLIGTGQRIGDVLAMQWGHVEDGGIVVRQGKTKAEVWIPFTARLSAALAETPKRGMHIITQANGRPVSYNLAWKWIRDVRGRIGAEAWDIHSLRHTAASELAALGLDDQHIMSITGHASTGMVRLYAGKAAQRARAKKAQEGRE